MLRQASCRKPYTYDCRKRSVSFRISYQRMKGKGLSVDCNIHNQGITRNTWPYAVTRSCRLVSYLIMLQFSEDFRTSPFPLGISLHPASAIGKKKGIRECLDGLKPVRSGHFRSIVFRSSIFAIKDIRNPGICTAA